MSAGRNNKKRRIYFSGGSGSSIEDAVIINSADPFEGISLESVFISHFYEIEGKKWWKLRQGLIAQNGKHYDVITAEEESGETREFYFDITAFYGNY